jgi:hypothetical protein
MVAPTKNREELAAALSAFANLYNREWRLEKLRYRSPLEARRYLPQNPATSRLT